MIKNPTHKEKANPYPPFPPPTNTNGKEITKTLPE
jgi:hypothetical protein